MANTGVKIVLTLREVEAPCPGDCDPTGNEKDNIMGDPDYIAPAMDTTSCPITYSTACQPVVATPFSNSVIFEFYLPNAVVLNPALAAAKIKLSLSSVEQASIVFNFPNDPPNYFSGILGGLTPITTYDFSIDYLNSSLAVVTSCPLGTIATTA